MKSISLNLNFSLSLVRLQFVFCKNCHQGYHIGECHSSSSDYFNSTGREYSVNFDRIADAKWDEASNIAIKVLTKPCPRCRTATERAGGCMHMVRTRQHCVLNI